MVWFGFGVLLLCFVFGFCLVFLPGVGGQLSRQIFFVYLFLVCCSKKEIRINYLFFPLGFILIINLAKGLLKKNFCKSLFILELYTKPFRITLVLTGKFL